MNLEISVKQVSEWNKQYYVIYLTKMLYISALKYTSTESIFNEAVKYERKLSRIVFFIQIEIIPACFFMPCIIYTIFIYFIIDSASDAFKLPFHIW